jgi:DNA polymerase III epsilon subunit-like protein
MNSILVFDFETTGLLHDPTIRPIEFFGLNINHDNVYEGHWLINCPFKLNPKIIKITGITDEELESDGIDLEIFLKKLDKVFSQNYDYIVGHNIIKFDIPLAEKLLNRTIRKDNIFDTAGAFKAKLLGYTNRYNNHYDYHLEALNTMRKGLFFNLKLAVEHYEIAPITGSLHRASTDVKYTYEVFKKQIN